MDKIWAWKLHSFSTGTTTWWDFKLFVKQLKERLKANCKAMDRELIWMNANHYTVSWFIYEPKIDKYVYISISDVRHNKDWYDRILIRTAKSDSDYTGWSNNFTSIEHLLKNIEKLFISQTN